MRSFFVGKLRRRQNFQILCHQSCAEQRARQLFRCIQIAASDVGGFRIGQNVTHPKFGSGVIVDAEGQGTDARVQVNFGSTGVKWLAVAMANLKAA